MADEDPPVGEPVAEQGEAEVVAETEVPAEAEAAETGIVAEAEPAEADAAEEESGEAQEGESVSERPDSPDDLDEAAGDEPQTGESEQS